MEGALTKLGFLSGKWQQRWFRLEGNVLSYGATRKKTKRKISVDDSCFVAPVVAGERPENEGIAPTATLKQPIPEHTFQLFDGDRTFYLVAANDEERDQWISALRKLTGGDEAPDEVYVKASRKQGEGPSYVHAGRQFFPLSAPPEDEEDAASLYVLKVHASTAQGYEPQPQAHPLYAYTGDPGLHTKGWRKRGNKFFPLFPNAFVPLPPR